MVKWHSSIKFKIAMPIFGVAILLTLMVFIVLTSALLPGILEHEVERVEKALLRATNTLKQEEISLGHFASDWAYWDDSYEFLAGRAPGFEKSNLNEESLRIAKLSLINMTTLNGDIVWGRHFKPEDEDVSYVGAPTNDGAWPEQFKEQLGHPTKEIDGYFSSHLGILIFSARPVLTSHKRGPAMGWLIVGRWINRDLKQQIVNRTQEHITFSTEGLEEYENPKNKNSSKIDTDIERLSFTQVRARMFMRDYKGDTAFSMAIKEERSSLIRAMRALKITFIGLIVAGLFCTWFAYQRVISIVMTPLSELMKSMEFFGYHSEQPSLPKIDNGDEIALLIRRYQEMANRLIKTQKALKKRSVGLEKEALTDPLTKLHNRRYLERLMARISENVLHESSQRKLLLAIDVDHFKKLNDNYGHATGDMVLLQLANILKSTFREKDHVVRMGGEEFLVVAACQEENYSQELAERVRSRVDEFKFGSDLNEPLPVTVSIGFAWFPLSQSIMSGENWQTGLKLADYGLYKAKMAGRNRWCGYYAVPSITYLQLTMIPDEVESLVELKVLRQVTSCR